MILSTITLLTLSPVTQSPADVIDRWVGAMNTRRYANLVAFHESLKWTDEPNDVAVQDWEFAYQAGRLEKVRDLSTSEKRLERLVRLNDVDGYIVLIADLSGPKPMLGLRGANATEAPVVRLTAGELVSQFKAYVERLKKAGKFSGSVVLAKDGSPIVQASGGLASRGYRIPNRIDTKFNLASMGKMFTATMIGVLKDEGKLDWDDKVGKFLPDYPLADVKEKVTIRHLLTHRSGLFDIFTPEYQRASKDAFKTVDQWMALFQNQPLRFEPGSQMQYSNAGFIVLGKIIEKLTGKDYFQAVRDRIFTPLGMKNTDAYELDRDVPNIAIGYTRIRFDGPPLEDGEPMNNLFLHTAKGSPAGGSYSTAPDMVRFGEAIRSGKLLKPATRDAMLGVGQAPQQGPMSFGLGFASSPLRSGDVRFGHSGGFPGINSNLVVYNKSGYSFAVLTNSDQDAQWVSRWLQSRIENLK